MNALPRQLALPLPHAPHYAASAFLPAPANAEARGFLSRPDAWPLHRLALWGEEGCGKTHLLHAWCEATGARLIAAASLPDLPDLPDLRDLRGRGIALDDADTIGDEIALLHWLNAAAEAAIPVLLAARTPPARWGMRLADLASRLAATLAVRLLLPDEVLLRLLFARLLAERRVAVSGALQDWLLARLPRHPGAIRAAAARLDRASLAAGHRVTRALAVAALRLCADGEETQEISPGRLPLL